MPLTARAERVGSLLRPPYLLAAREALAAGKLAPPAFKRVEDRAVREAVALQEDAGCPIVRTAERVLG
jgi:5-methyltetrahydropteroyltriglutamate--homocysteine methyltransferase